MQIMTDPKVACAIIWLMVAVANLVTAIISRSRR